MRIVGILLVSLLLFGVLGFVGFSLGEAQNVQLNVFTIPTRQGVTVKTLLVTLTGTSKGVLVLFIGGAGLQAFGGCCQGGQVNYNDNFLSRSTPLFTAQGYSVLLVNAPSDQPKGMSLDFRLSSANAQDISMIIDFLISKSLKPIFLVGTSRGTISVENFASTNPNDNRISGIVLTSTYSLSELQILVKGAALQVQSVALPVLFVHNVFDGCSETPFQAAVDFSKTFTRSSKLDFIKVQDQVTPDPDPCGAMSAHGYKGAESQAVQDVTDWTSQISSISQSSAITPMPLLILSTPNSKERISSEIFANYSVFFVNY